MEKLFSSSCCEGKDFVPLLTVLVSGQTLGQRFCNGKTKPAEGTDAGGGVRRQFGYFSGTGWLFCLYLDPLSNGMVYYDLQGKRSGEEGGGEGSTIKVPLLF